MLMHVGSILGGSIYKNLKLNATYVQQASVTEDAKQ